MASHPKLSVIERCLLGLWLGLSGFGYLLFIRRTSFRANEENYYTLFDDAMVSMRYARNFAEGFGLNWNYSGAPVEGFTNFLWTMWMSALHLLPIPESKVPLAVMLSGAAILVLNAWVIFQVARHLDARPVVRWVALLLTTTFYPLLFWVLRGMEVGLICLEMNLGVLLALSYCSSPRQWKAWALGGVLALGVLTRPDAVLFVGLIASGTWWFCDRESRKQLTLPVALPVVLAVMSLTVWRFAYYGEWLPNTYFLKVGGAGFIERAGKGLGVLWQLALKGFWLPLVFGAVGAFALYQRKKLEAVLVGGLCVMHLAYSVYIGGDAWEWFGFANRFITSVSPLLFVLTALGMTFLLAKGLRLGRPRFAAVGFTVGAILILGGPYKRWYQWNVEHYYDDVANTKIGLHIRKYTSPDAKIAVVMAGSIPYFAKRHAIDLLGKSDPVIAKMPPKRDPKLQPGHTKWNYAYSMGELKPDVITRLWHPNTADLKLLSELGYVKLSNTLWVSSSSPRVYEAQFNRQF